MTVEVLRLSDLEADDALKAAEKLLDHKAGGPLRLRRLLLLDDADRLVEHEQVYRRLETGRRVADTLCVAAGPFGAADAMPALPEGLGGNQGTGVIWVGNEVGVDWRLAAPTADGRADTRVSGLGYLVDLLSDDDLFSCVHRAFREAIPGKVASPGLWLAGADAEDATFAAALALAIGRLTQSGQRMAGPFAGLLPAAAGGAALAPGGRLARDRNEVAEWSTAAAKALEKGAGLGRLFGRGDGGARDHAIEGRRRARRPARSGRPAAPRRQRQPRRRTDSPSVPANPEGGHPVPARDRGGRRRGGGVARLPCGRRGDRQR